MTREHVRTGAPVGWTGFGAAVLAIALTVLVVLRVPTTAYLASAAVLGGIVLGVVSLVRRERPAAPALLGLVPSVLLAGLILYAIFS